MSQTSRKNNITPAGAAVQKLNGFLIQMRVAAQVGNRDLENHYNNLIQHILYDLDMIGAKIEINPASGRYRTKFAPKLQVSPTEELLDCLESRTKNSFTSTRNFIDEKIREINDRIYVITAQSIEYIKNADYSFTSVLHDLGVERETWSSALALLSSLELTVLQEFTLQKQVTQVSKNESVDVEEELYEDEADINLFR